MQQNNAPLPFPSERLNMAPYQIIIGQPPYTPQGIGAAPWILPYVPFVTSLAQDYLMRTAQQGPISMFFYNMMTDANWNTRQFWQLIQDACDFIYVKNSNWVPPQHSIENTIANGVAEFMQLRSLGCLIEFPQLWYYVRPEDQPVINGQLQVWRQVMGQVEAMRQSTPQGFQGGQQVGYHPQQPQYSGHGHQQQGPRGHVPFTAQGSAYIQGSAAGGPGYGPHVQQSAHGSGGRSFGGGGGQQAAPQQQQYSAPQQPQQQAAAPQQPTGPVPANNNAGGNTMTMNLSPSLPPNLIEAGDITWKASKNHPEFAYPPSFNPIKNRMYFEVQSDKSTVPVIRNVTDLNMIDFDRHAIASLFGKPPSGMQVARDASQIHQKLDAGISAIDDEARNATEDTPTVLTKSVVLTDTTLDNAFMTARLDMMSIDKKKPMVYRMFARVFTPIAGWEDETAQIQAFARCASYIALREELKAAGEVCSPELVSHVNLMMTEHCNHILHKRLSISPFNGVSGLTMEDFTNDLDKLLAHLGEAYGEGIAKAFLLDQRREIANLFHTVDQSTEAGQELYQALAGNMLGEEWADKQKQPQFTFIGRVYNLTLIDMLSHDLQVAGVEGVGNALLSNLHPTLSNLAKNIMASDEQFGSDFNAAHHLVRTKDGRIFEITKGHINNDFLLISLVK